MTQRATHYGGAGVDIDAADSAKHDIAPLVASTRTSGSIGGFGGFGGMFRIPERYMKGVLVSSADGVGTKLKVAALANRHDTVGRDLVNHCVNDILVQGASPLFFMDYVAFGTLDASVLHGVVSGVAAGCRDNGCELLGGETAEMPGLYTPPDYDLAGFIVGIVEEDQIRGSERVEVGDVLVGLASAGLHTNGYSLARQVLFERMRLSVHDRFPGAERSVGDVLLDEHRSYLRLLSSVLEDVHALAHITGGGIPGNLNRILPANADSVVERASWEVPHVFHVIRDGGGIERDEMFRVFNMGIGMIAVTPASSAAAITAAAERHGVKSWIIGHVAAGSGHVKLT